MATRAATDESLAGNSSVNDTEQLAALADVADLLQASGIERLMS